MKILEEKKSSVVLELSVEEAEAIAADLRENADLVGAGGAELLKLLPQAQQAHSVTMRYEWIGPEDLRGH
ncbi:hypothetical protein [Acidithiobacillus caldus]|uniref:Uncharacterized protein n=1 Tax=Acidithiobacillus caldus TaxID=33059 RepID=A0A1E7YR37_9PROT|nr:hypothetical protein [Acidithiobacillus caldus]MCY0872975.1 hypothetical protein [Acidithiobacillus caldus]OFC36097.1 hypothetical protein BAE29_13775 [Acidithiobacillus caldus]OFC39156.1 hypothetical protein BAE27_00395 [Acidithiobacillus caldus]OFC39797.1 hypothetical protein BAE28_02325 [Acidithiobacillus caldus]